MSNVMSKRKLSTILAIAISLMAGCISADAEEEAQYEVGSIYLGETSNPRLQELPELSIKHSGEVGLQDTSSLAPAAGVTYFQVRAVSSTQHPTWEYFDEFKSLTDWDHGGSVTNVAIFQYGYGSGGATYSSFPGTNYLNEYYCGPFATAHRCNVGETVTGFMVYYRFTVPQNGNFSAYTDSSAYPWGRKTDAIIIR